MSTSTEYFQFSSVAVATFSSKGKAKESLNFVRRVLFCNNSAAAFDFLFSVLFHPSRSFECPLKRARVILMILSSPRGRFAFISSHHI